MTKNILFIPHNHLDPIWRRCFDRPAHHSGVTVRSYAEVEELIIDRFLDLAEKGHTYSDGQMAIWRKYLERNPERKDELQALVASGQLEMNLAGETVQDSNLPAAEGLIRNFLVALPLHCELAGDEHIGMKMAWLEDAFGNSPNYPQVLRGVGAEVCCHLSYRGLPEDIWVGIDGTPVPCYDGHPWLHMGAYEKHAPCPTCAGASDDCGQCGGNGLDLSAGYDLEAVRKTLETAAEREEEVIAVVLQTEELLPDLRFHQLIAELNASYDGQCRFRFANPSDVYLSHKPHLERALVERDESPSVDLNPAMSGCYVSRIRTKQRTRSVAYRLLAAEARLATDAWRAKTPTAPPPALAEAWQKVAFNQFHDAITGTQIDSAYRELMDMLDEADATAGTIIGSEVAPALPAGFQAVAKEGGVLELGPYSIRYDLEGILGIERDGIDCFGQPGCYHHKRPPRIAELVLENDSGDAWGQRIPPFSNILWDNHQILLGRYHYSVEQASAGLRWHGKYSGGDPMIKTLDWTLTLGLDENGLLCFTTAVNWDTHSRRLRVLVPVDADDDTATWEVPFGHIQRRYEPELLDYSQWKANHMEFPALHWVHKEIDGAKGVALFNRGLPCNRWVPGRFDLSLLRSPEFGFCMNEPTNYEFWDTDGQRDSGEHRFEYALLPHTAALGFDELTKLGYVYNDANRFDLPFEVDGAVVVTAWKPSEDGKGWVLRVQEAAGQESTCVLRFDAPCAVRRCNLVEEAASSEETKDVHEWTLHRHEIATFRINPNG
jgi:alpha-mannosidase